MPSSEHPTGEGKAPTRVLASAESASLLAQVEASAAARPSANGSDANGSAAGAGFDAPEPVTPGEVAPQRVLERMAPVTKTKPSRRLQPGDLICGQCGEGNPPTRKFCSRCGSELSEAQVVRARWWRRLLRGRRRTRTMEAGARPGQQGVKKDVRARLGGTYRKIRATLAALTLLLGLLYVAVSPLRGVINRAVDGPVTSVKQTVGGWWHALTYPYEDLAVQRSRALPKDPRHPSSEAFDSDTLSFWAAPWSKSKKPMLSVRFEESRDVAAILVHNGASGRDAEKYLQPRDLRVQYGDGRTEDLELKFSLDPQTIHLEGGSTVRRMSITVLTVYGQEGLEDVAIRNIEFKTRK